MEDERCCGTGTCLINDEGLCWCGQQWNGEVMCRPSLPLAEDHKAGPLQDGATQEHAS